MREKKHKNTLPENNMYVGGKQKFGIGRILIFKLLLTVIIIAVLAVGIYLIVKGNFSSQKEEAEIITETELYKIVNSSELSTYQCVYNDICTVKDKNNEDKILYHCAYEARVNAGIDFSKVKIKVNSKDDSHKIVNVSIPEVTITDINVDISSLDYIWEDRSANTDTVSEQAYKACIKDVTDKTKSELKIYELAQQNAENMIEALIKPFIDGVNSQDVEYKITIESEGVDKK